MTLDSSFLKYQLVSKYINVKYKEIKGHKPSKTQCGTTISGTVKNTTPLVSVIIKYLKNKTFKV